MAEDALSQALHALACAFNSADFLRVVGDDGQQLLRERFDRVKVCLSATPGSDRPGKQSRALYSLARECIDLASSVDKDLPEAVQGASTPEVSAQGERDDSHVVVLEAAANALAAFAASIQPDSSRALADLLEHLSLDLSYLAVHIFNGTQQQGNGENRMCRALQAICTWAAAAVGRTVGYPNLTARVLWEWARCDAVWVFALAKGVLSSRAAEAAGRPSVVPPRDLPELQAAVLAAVLDLPSPAVVFSSDSCDVDGTIAARNEGLIRHRVDLASAVVNCQVPQVIASCVAGTRSRAVAGLAGFLKALLQPELAETGLELASSKAAEAMSEVLLGASSATGADAIRQAQAASTALAQQLLGCQEVLWRALADTPRRCKSRLPAPFAADCAALAYFVPPSAQSFDDLCGRLRESCLVREEAALTAALCLLAANAGLVPSAGGLLAGSLPGLPAEVREAVAAQWLRWRGPVRVQELGQWAQALEVSWTPPPLAAQPEVSPASPAKGAPPPALPRPPPGRGSVLQELIHDAPEQFRCALSGQLMMDPVRTPHGLVCDRAVLASALGQQPGVCPLTGNALALSECNRLPAVRKQITCWVREHRARCPTGRRR
mmetsp:Transcript_79770/g.248605  ORF Transcript_79770/g.248605 Transcript_79770/m.248605 type:complete len:608 (-) Transcript_79770:343-2166(-)